MAGTVVHAGVPLSYRGEGRGVGVGRGRGWRQGRQEEGKEVETFGEGGHVEGLHCKIKMRNGRWTRMKVCAELVVGRRLMSFCVCFLLSEIRHLQLLLLWLAVGHLGLISR